MGSIQSDLLSQHPHSSYFDGVRGGTALELSIHKWLPVLYLKQTLPSAAWRHMNSHRNVHLHYDDRNAYYLVLMILNLSVIISI
jgi:hypothetical protein